MVDDPTHEETSLMNDSRENTSPRIELHRSSSASISNRSILRLSALLFAGFVLAETIGALVSGSLSLLGDALAMGVDVLTYLANLYAEQLKYSNYHSPQFRRIVFDIVVPATAVVTLLGVTTWILSEAIQVIHQSSNDDDVPISYLYGFSIANLVIDVVCNILFFIRGTDVFYHQSLGIESHYSAIETENIETTSNHNAIHSDLATSTLHDRAKLSTFLENESQYDVNIPDEGSAVLDSSVNYVDQSYDSVAPLSSTLRLNPVTKRRWNLNMWSAFAHVSGDTVRTLSVLIAAVVSTTTGFDSALCDAWAAIICSLTIVVIAFVLVNELRKTSISIEDNSVTNLENIVNLGTLTPA